MSLIRVLIRVEGESCDSIEALIRNNQPSSVELGFETQSRVRDIDPTVVVAVVAGLSGFVTGVVAGLGQWFAARHGRSGSINIQTREGVSISIPLNSSQSDLDRAEAFLAGVREAHLVVESEDAQAEF